MAIEKQTGTALVECGSKTQYSRLVSILAYGVATLLLSACSSDPSASEKARYDHPVDSYDLHAADALDNDDLVDDAKADAVFPSQFDLLDTMTPVRNQSSRGTCSFFTAAALVEQLLVREGFDAPDLSEQYYVWLMKGKLGKNADREGGSPSQNLDALLTYGMIAEQLWEYDGRVWTTRDDPACDRTSSSPVGCRTQGEPPERALSTTERTYLTTQHYVRRGTNNIKHHLYIGKRGVIVSMPVHCQTWNRASCALPSPYDRYAKGIITTPNETDIQNRLNGKRTSHAVLIVGYDDDFEAPRLDSEGQPMRDESGDVVKDKGFFIAKNSWGTDNVGHDNPYEAGYLLFSYNYIEKYAIALATAGINTESTPPKYIRESCVDGIDNDGDDKSDCDDEDCDPFDCRFPRAEFSVTDPVEIPDNESQMTAIPLEVARQGWVRELAIEVGVEHEQLGDVEFYLQHESMRTEHKINFDRTLLRRGGSRTVRARLNKVHVGRSEGTWNLLVRDRRPGHRGRILGWSLFMALCDSEECTTHGPSSVHSSSEALPLLQPVDGTPRETVSRIEVLRGGIVRRAVVHVDIEHERQADLRIRLVRRVPLGHDDQYELFEGRGPEGRLGEPFAIPMGKETASDPGTNALGQWDLIVVDHGSGAQGVLRSWSIAFEYCDLDEDCVVSTAYYKYDDDGDQFWTLTFGDTVVETEMQEPGTVDILKVWTDIWHDMSHELSARLEKVDQDGQVVHSAELFPAESDPVHGRASFSIMTDAFAGVPIEGTWRLVLADEVEGVDGELIGWGLQIWRVEDEIPTTRDRGIFISEYIEGGSGAGTHKAVEIYNASDTDYAALRCAVVVYNNGSTDPKRIPIDVNIGAGDVLAVCHSAYNGSFCTIRNGLLNHNGDDALALECNGQIVDVLGVIGQDPGTAWTGGGASTKDSVLRRSCSVQTGWVPTGTDAFDPSAQWEPHPFTDTSDFGVRHCP